VRVDGRSVRLTTSEFELLWTLLGEPGHVFSRDALRDRIYGPDVVVVDRTVDTFVKRLRHKLEQVDPRFDGIETVRGVGYRLKA
jgi:two-component system response regulator ChvI